MLHGMVRVSVLASGSKGNCTIISSSRTRILVDAGLSCRELLRRLKASGQDAHELTAIVITHEHSDHVNGLRVLARKLKLPLYITGATCQAWTRFERQQDPEFQKPERIEYFEAGRSFHIGDVEVMPFTIPHDAADPVGFTFRVEGVKIGMATDLGYIPASVEQHLKGCAGLIIESNHDLEMLRSGPYPWSVKQRVMSRVGHLSNDALADFFANSYDGEAAFLVLAHLSEQNNHPEIARRSAEQALQLRPSLFAHRLALASQSEPLEPIVVG
jgi:phosphoribosyl 1,2-cyclic phosphodiesterase